MHHEAAKRMTERFKPIPQKVIMHLMKKGILTAALDRDRDIEILDFLHRTWSDATILRAQLATLPKKRRLDLVETADLNKWETYVWSRYKNSSGRLTVGMIAGEVEAIFGVKIDGYIIMRILVIRKKVQNARYYKTKRAAGQSRRREDQKQ